MMRGKGLGIVIVAVVLPLVTGCAASTIPTTGWNGMEIGAIHCLTGGGGTSD